MRKMTKENLIQKLKDANLYDMAHGFWLLVLFPDYQDGKMTEKDLLSLLELEGK